MTQQQNNFLQSVEPAAVGAQKAYGIPAPITRAQAILESGWGQSQLARRCYNYFGIKANQEQIALEQYEEFPTREFVKGRSVSELAKFAKYPSPEMGFLAHARLLALASRYKPAMEAADKGPAAFAIALQGCGYSTACDDHGNPNYAVTLMRLVNQFDLAQYDVPQSPSPATPTAPATPVSGVTQ